MAGPSGEDLNTELEASLRKIETRLESNETMQKTTSQRLDELYKALVERLDAKNQSVDDLKKQGDWVLKQNDTLLKQIGLRWNLLTGLTTLVGLAFTITLGYQIWRVEQVMETKRDLEQGIRSLDQNTRTYSEILSLLARADSFMSQSNREFQRSEFLTATTLSAQAIEFLRLALQKTGIDPTEIRTSYDGKTCTASPVVSSHASSPEVSLNSGFFNKFLEAVEGYFSHSARPTASTSLNLEALSPAVKDALFTAYDMHARAGFFSHPRVPPREDGKMLLALDPNRWEGYHWIGLSAEGTVGIDSYAEASECFLKSVGKSSVGNKDYLNLAELAFLRSDYTRATNYADQYLSQLNYRFDSPVDVVAQFFFSTAGFLSRNATALDKMSPSKFREEVAKLHNFTLAGTFSAKDLDTYLESKSFTDHLTEEEPRRQVYQSYICFTKQECCSTDKCQN